MKKRTIIFLVIMTALACLLAISASADTLKGADTDAFGEISTLSTPVGRTDFVDADTHLTNKGNVARVVLYNEADGKYYTFPTTYILEKNAYSSEVFQWNLNALNTALGTSYEKKHIYRIEIPIGNKLLNTTSNQRFDKWTNVKEVVLAKNMFVGNANSGALFEYCYKLETVENFDTLALKDKNLDYSFRRCYELKSVKLPENNTTITSIENYAFEGCKLEEIDLSGFTALKKIEGKVFYSCSSLKGIKFPDSLESIGGVLFDGCSVLTEVVLPENCTLNLSDYQFKDCKALERIVCSNISGTAIGYRAFMNCTNLKEFTIPETVTSIGEEAFDGCASLERLIIPDSVTIMGDEDGNVIAGCTSLKTLVLPKNLKSLGKYAIEGCTSLERVWMPAPWIEDSTAKLTMLDKVFAKTGKSGVEFYLRCTEAELATYIDQSAFVTDEEKDGWKNGVFVYGATLSDKCEKFLEGHSTPDGYNDCTEDYTCTVCITAQSAFATEHDLVTKVTYENGFAQSGRMVVTCDNCVACTVENKKETLGAIFTAKGYSYKDGTNGGISGGFYVNRDLAKLYKDANPDAEMTVSVIMVNPKYLTTDSMGEFFDESGTLKTKDGAMQIDISNLSYENYDYTISGFNLELMQNLELAFAIVVCDGEGIEVVQKQYADGEMSALKNTYEDINGITLNTVTVESIAPSVVAELKSKEEII